jgi:DNA topoisomerase-1
VNDLLVDRFPELLDAGFTAKMENDLDDIENAKRQWVKVVRDFYTPFQSVLAQATQDAGRVKPQDIPTDINCEKCGSPMVVRWGRHGRFLACTGYPKCKNTKPISGNGEKQAEPVMSGETCDKCGAAMLIKTGRFGKFLACSNYPECKSSRPLSTGVKCPQDGGDIVERRSKKGRRFWSCSNYPSCTFSLWSRPVPKACPRCSSPFLIERRDKAGNIQLSCPTKDCRYRETVAEEAPQAT